MKYTVLPARALFALIFIIAGLGHFSAETIAFSASQGVPFAAFLVPFFSGVMSLAGGLSILIGYKAKWGAWILVLFLLPVTIMLHNFWVMPDGMMKQMQMAMFMKNVALIGGAMFIGYFGAGPLSLDAREKNSIAEPVKNSKDLNLAGSTR